MSDSDMQEKEGTMKCKLSAEFNGGEPSYYILACKVTADVVKKLRWRSIANPELSYFVTRLDEDAIPADEILARLRAGIYKGFIEL